MDYLGQIDIEEFVRATASNPRRSLLSPKVRKKLGKLHKWRVDASMIRFWDDVPKIEGGFAVVSRADLLSVDQTTSKSREIIAIKEMKVRDAGDRNKVLGSALREAEFLVNFRHRNIIKFYGFTEDVFKDTIWLIFPWAENGNLRDFVALADWEVPERIWLIRGVIEGLSYLHGLKPPVCHGDLKSINVLVNSGGDAVITDFGSTCRVRSHPTKIEASEEQGGSEERQEPELSAAINEVDNTITLTQNNFTLRWAAPEVLKDEDQDIASDIWSFGWVCYEVMTGNIPFENIRNESVVTLKIVEGRMPSLDKHARMALIWRLASLMVGCWSLNARNRPNASECQRQIKIIPHCRPQLRESQNTDSSRAVLLSQLGDMYSAQSFWSKAEQCFTEAVALFTKAGNMMRVVGCSSRLADMHRLQDEYDTATSLYTECIRMCEEGHWTSQRAQAIWGLAIIHLARGESDEAFTLFREFVKICEGTKEEYRPIGLWGLAKVHIHRKEFAEATSLLHECILIFDELGQEDLKANSFLELADIYRRQEDYDQAVSLYLEATQLFTAIGDKRGKASGLEGFAFVHEALGEYDKAVPLRTEIIQLYTETSNKRQVAEALFRFADLHQKRADYASAISIYTECVKVSDEIGNAEIKEHALQSLAQARRYQAEAEEIETHADPV